MSYNRSTRSNPNIISEMVEPNVWWDASGRRTPTAKYSEAEIMK